MTMHKYKKELLEFLAVLVSKLNHFYNHLWLFTSFSNESSAKEDPHYDQCIITKGKWLKENLDEHRKIPYRINKPKAPNKSLILTKKSK